MFKGTVVNGSGVCDYTKEHFVVRNNTFQDVYSTSGSRIPSSACILPEIVFLFHDKEMQGEEE